MGDTRATDSLLSGIETAKSGNKLLARLHLLQAVELAPRDPNCWLWLAWVAESPASAMHSLQRVLDEEPNHELALLGMKWASAMADFEYQENTASQEQALGQQETGTEESDAVAVREDNKPEVDQPFENAEEDATPDSESGETETWEAETEIEVELPVYQALDEDDGDQEEANAGSEGKVSEFQDEEVLEFQETIAEESFDSNDLDSSGLVSELTAATENCELVQEGNLEEDTTEASEDDCSTDWFTHDATAPGESPPEEQRFPVEEELHQPNCENTEVEEELRDLENTERVEQSRETEAFQEPASELSDTAEEHASHATDWQVTSDEDALNADRESNTKEAGEGNFEQPTNRHVDGGESSLEEVPESQSDEGFLPADLMEQAVTTIEQDPPPAEEELISAARVEEAASSEPAAEKPLPPENEATLEQALPAEPPQEMDYGVSVLVVDDSPTVRKLVAMTLEKHGHTVGAAADGVVALKTIAELKPRLILLDITMPRLGGYQLCKLIKKHESTKHIPVIMLSGKDGMFDKVRGKFVGCDDYITKPFDPEVLVDKVSTQLSEHYGVTAVQS